MIDAVAAFKIAERSDPHEIRHPPTNLPSRPVHKQTSEQSSRAPLPARLSKRQLVHAP